MLINPGADGFSATTAKRGLAKPRFLAWHTAARFVALAPLRRVQAQMTEDRFGHRSQVLRHPSWQVTNNGAARGGRAFHHRQRPHVNLCQLGTIQARMRVVMQQQRHATAGPATQPAARCGRGRAAHRPPRLVA